MRAATDLGFRVTVFIMPVLPKLTDSREHLDAALRAISEAGAHRVVYGALHLRPGAREWFFEWLGREHPELLPRYRRMYANSPYASREYRTWAAHGSIRSSTATAFAGRGTRTTASAGRSAPEVTGPQPGRPRSPSARKASRNFRPPSSEPRTSIPPAPDPNRPLTTPDT